MKSINLPVMAHLLSVFRWVSIHEFKCKLIWFPKSIYNGLCINLHNFYVHEMFKQTMKLRAHKNEWWHSIRDNDTVSYHLKKINALYCF